MKRHGIRFAMSGLFVAALWAQRAQAAEPKFGFVDMERALMETEDGRKARSTLKRVFDQKQKELDEQQTNLKKKMEDLEKKRTLMAPEALRKSEGEIQEELAKVQQTYMRHQQDLAKKEQDATGPILERMQRIILTISDAENLDMVFDRRQAGLVFAKPSLDLTNEVIRRYNAGEGKSGGGGKTTPSKSKKK